MMFIIRTDCDDHYQKSIYIMRILFWCQNGTKLWSLVSGLYLKDGLLCGRIWAGAVAEDDGFVQKCFIEGNLSVLTFLEILEGSAEELAVEMEFGIILYGSWCLDDISERVVALIEQENIITDCQDEYNPTEVLEEPTWDSRTCQRLPAC